MTLILQKEKLQHLNSITHESKVLVLATDTDGKIFYTVKQDGFEDSYLNTPAEQRTGWENWQQLEFPDEKVDDQSVIEKETASLTYQKDTNKFILRSRYRTNEESSVAPVQLVSALGHIYVFRQSKSNTLLVDRFVLDGMTNKLNRKLEVRFKRSKQKHTPTKNMNKGTNGLVNIDSLDFRDANGNFFYEPTTELCSVSNLQKGWFSVVLVPTIENDVYRWHIFAYNSQTQKVELTTIRASEEGLFDVKDYTIFDQVNDGLVPRSIPGVIKRTLDIGGVSVTNGLSATKYDLQQEQKTQSGDDQLIKTATRLLLAIPTDKGTAAFSFAIAGDGTLSQIDETAENTILRSTQREILLPLNTLDEIKAIADRTPPDQGIITGLAEGTDEEDAEDLVKISTQGAAELGNYDLVKISGTSDYQGLYRAKTVDKNTFEIDLPSVNGNGLGYWEKEDPEESGLIFDGMITAYQKIADGKLRVICPDHNLENGDEVQIAGTDDYNDTYPVQKIDDTHFVIERKWATREAINVKLVSRKRRGVVFDGVDDYIEIADPFSNTETFTICAWIKPAHINTGGYQGFIGKHNDKYRKPSLWVAPDQGGLHYFSYTISGKEYAGTLNNFFDAADTWVHVAWVKDGTQYKFYKNGEQFAVQDAPENFYTEKKSGYWIGKVDNFFSGQIAEVRIWKTARTTEDIKNSMYLPLTGKEIGLVGYWRLGGISEGKVIDFSANGNDGTVYGDAYVSAATLNRKLAGGSEAVKYSNPDLVAVSERATYEESFEFKVNSSTAVDLAYLDNADGKGNKIFTLAYWGKTSRSAEEKKPISAVQNKFQDLGNGWYRASCNFTIPDEVSLLRSFEIDKIQGNWVSLEIRKHRIRLLSDSITEAKYTDGVTLATLADSQTTLAAKLKQLELKEQQEGVLLKEKRELEDKLAKLKDLDATIAQKNTLSQEVDRLRQQKNEQQTAYDREKNSPSNYLWYLENKASGLAITHWVDSLSSNSVWIAVSLFPDRLVFLTRSNRADYQWSFIDAGDGWFSLKIGANTEGLKTPRSGSLYMFSNASDNAPHGVRLLPDSFFQQYPDRHKFKLIDAGGGYYYIQIKETGRVLSQGGGSVYKDEVILLQTRTNNDYEKFRLVKVEEKSLNGKVENILNSLNQIQTTLKLKEQELATLIEVINEGTSKKTAWENRLREVITQLTAIQTEINTLNTDFINGVKNTQQTPQTMPQVTKDGKGLVTQGALLGFVQPASRLNAIETCEGNVQLSYFDTQGRMRQTNYDTTADSKNTAFEQWIPDAQRACLNFNNRNSVVRLNQPLVLPSDWSIEAWFVYPLPKTGEWNSLTRGGNYSTKLIVKNGKQLGTFLGADVLNPRFCDSGFNMELLPPGWHHLAAVGRGDTTLFYINGKKVGDTKAKALADAEENLKKNPNDATANKKVEDINKAILKDNGNIDFICNTEGGDSQFGKVAEVRIWGVSLSDEEIAVNSKTLLSGNEPGLLAYYPMNEATGETVRNQTGSGNNGTVSGATWWGCSAPIGNQGNTVMQFDGVNDHVHLPGTTSLDLSKISAWSMEAWIKPQSFSNSYPTIFSYGRWMVSIGLQNGSGKLESWLNNKTEFISNNSVPLNQWTHVVLTYSQGGSRKFYINGVEAGTTTQAPPVEYADYSAVGIASLSEDKYSAFDGQIAEVQIWNKARTQAEIQADMYKRLSGKEPNLVAYYPLNEIKPEGSTRKVKDLVGNNHGTVTEAITVDSNTLPIGGDALVSNEYSTVTLENTRKIAIMRRFFASTATNGATLLPDKRIEALQLKWIGNAQFAPTLLGYIEGPPPVPSENLTVEDDYNGATSVELTMSEDVEFSWNRSEESGLGGSGEFGAGVAFQASAGLFYEQTVADINVGFAGNFEGSKQSLNESSITASSSQSMTDKLELRGTPEEAPKFPHLGNRFIPKNIGYALVVSALADVFVIHLARSGKMVGYEVLPIDSIPPDVNTITFLMNPAYTMNGSLDGLTGSSATSDRFFKHVPEMRSQYGSLYPASYYRLQEAYDLKRQIEAEDKRRESYFANFDVSSPAAMDREIDKGPAPSSISVQREEDKPNSNQTDKEKEKEREKELERIKAQGADDAQKNKAAAEKKKAEIASKIKDIEKRSQATDGFARWQKRMEDIQIRAGKRNIVNTYVWDADGGLRTESQSFANTVEHTIGGSSSLNMGLGLEADITAGMVSAALTAQATVSLTQTMSKTETRSKGFELNVDLGGLEHKGITDYKDHPILPGEKVDRYRFMSFYLEGSTNHFQDFFNYVVDPEWLRSNDEEARALRQAQAGKPNKAWRVLHRVTYVERPALMGFGRDIRKLRAAAATSDHNQLKSKNRPPGR